MPATHISEDLLELYLLERLPKAELDALDQHLMVCHLCVDQIEQAQTELFVLTQACAQLEVARRKEGTLLEIARALELKIDLATTHQPVSLWLSIAAAGILLALTSIGIFGVQTRNQATPQVSIASLHSEIPGSAEVPGPRPEQVKSPHEQTTSARSKRFTARRVLRPARKTPVAAKRWFVVPVQRAYISRRLALYEPPPVLVPRWPREATIIARVTFPSEPRKLHPVRRTVRAVGSGFKKLGTIIAKVFLAAEVEAR
jgi:hypothetical protein